MASRLISAMVGRKQVPVSWAIEGKFMDFLHAAGLEWPKANPNARDLGYYYRHRAVPFDEYLEASVPSVTKKDSALEKILQPIIAKKNSAFSFSTFLFAIPFRPESR